MPGPVTPCRYPVPLPKYGSVARCKDGVKAPCNVIPECWAHAGGDVVKSMHCQQEYVRDLALHLFKTDMLFRTAWINYVKSFHLASIERGSTINKSHMNDYVKSKANYNSALQALNVSNDVTRYAEHQLERDVAGPHFVSLNTVAAFKSGVIEILRSAFSSLFVFADGKIDHTKAPVGKYCRDIENYYTFIDAVNVLLTQGKKSGGRKTRTNKKSNRSTRRR